MTSEAAKAAAEIFPSMSEKRRHEAAMGLDDHRKRAERIIQGHYDAATAELWFENERLRELQSRIKQHWIEGVSEETENENTWHGTMRDILEEIYGN